MSTITSNATQASRVRYLQVVHVCGHTSEVKVSPTIRAAYVRAIRREAKRSLCQGCRTVAANRTRHTK